MTMKTTTQHTPGPWRLRPAGEESDYNTVEPYDFIEVAPYRFIRCEGRGEAEANANARLIAAAPELLAALESFLPYFDNTRRVNEEHSRMYWSVRNAITKAKGVTP